MDKHDCPSSILSLHIMQRICYLDIEWEFVFLYFLQKIKLLRNLVLLRAVEK